MKNYWLAVIGLFIFIFLFCITKVADPDIGWWIKSGEYIFTQRNIPLKDIFTYTVPERVWVIQGWLATVFFYLIYSVTGIEGLTIFKALLIVLTFMVLLKLMLRKKMSYPLSILLLTLAVLLARHRFIFASRPLIFKYPFMVLFLYLLSDYVENVEEPSKSKKRLLLLLPVLMLFWTNLHGSFYAGYIIICAFIGGEFVKNLVLHRKIIDRKLGFLLFVLLLTVVVSLVNPYGLYLHQWNVELFTKTSLLRTIVNEEFLPPSITDYPLFWFSLILISVSFLFTLRKFNRTTFFLFLPFAYLAVKGVRYIGLFAVTSAPVLGENLNLLFRSERIRRLSAKIQPFIIDRTYWIRIFTNILLLLLMVYLFFFIFSPRREFKWGLGIQRGYTPDGAIEFVEKNGISGNLYNSEEFGGYIIWRWYPQRKIFILGDNLLCEDIRAQVYQNDITGVETLFEKYKVNYILKSYQTPPLEGYYLSRGNWKLVYWDNIALVYLRDNKANKEIIKKYVYKYVDPLSFDFSFAQTLARHNFAQKAIEELQRNIAENPNNFKAYLFLGYLYESLNRSEEALLAYLKVKQLQPFASYIHYQLGLYLGKLYLEKNPHQAIKELSLQRKYLSKNAELEFYLGTAYYFLGNYKMAMKKFNSSLKLNPQQAVVNSNLGFLYFDLARYREAIEKFEKAIAIDPNYPDPYYGLAIVYEKLVEKEEAIKSWEKYLTLSKDPRWIATAKEHLEKLQTQKTQK